MQTKITPTAAADRDPCAWLFVRQKQQIVFHHHKFDKTPLSIQRLHLEFLQSNNIVKFVPEFSVLQLSS